MKMAKVLWWLLFDDKVVMVDGVTLGIVLPREEFSLGCRAVERMAAVELF